jgi:hypothetical protein
MGMPHKSNSSSTHSSSNDLSAHDEGVSQPVQEAPLPANQEQVMDDFMVDWFGLDIVDDMYGNHMMKEPMQMFHIINILPRDNGSGKRRRHMLEHLFFKVQG